MSTAKQVRDYLGSLPLLSVIKLSDVYSELAAVNRDAIRAAIYGCSAGSPVARKNPPSNFYAIYLKIKHSPDDEDDVLLSLTGIPREKIIEDADTTGTIYQIIQNFKEKYGEKTVQYWVTAAQYRSVQHTRGNMRRVRDREKVCRVCQVSNKIRRDGGLVDQSIRSIKVCHIISRKYVYWKFWMR